MKLIKNSGNDRVIDELRTTLPTAARLDMASPEFSLFAFGELRKHLEALEDCRLILPASEKCSLQLLGLESDRPFRNQLRARALAGQCAGWIKKKVELRGASSPLPQSTLIASGPTPNLCRAITGNCVFSTSGLGLTPGNQFSLIQCSESAQE